MGLSGEEKAWAELVSLRPSDVCKKAKVSFDLQEKYYLLDSFGACCRVFPAEKRLDCLSEKGEVLTGKLGYFFSLSALWYLVLAKDIPLSGHLEKPVNLKDGQLFFRGTHQLPLERLAKRFDHNRESFIKKGIEFGGRQTDYGDMSVELPAMPRVPVTLILWNSDDEFRERADLLFDSTCEKHVPIDVLWSLSMLSVLIMCE